MIMFEVILLALMGSNNAAREVAGERKIMEKEKFGGVRPVSYLLSKLAFLTCLILAQSLWMAMFVEFFWQFSGSFISHISFLILVNALIAIMGDTYDRVSETRLERGQLQRLALLLEMLSLIHI